MQPVTRWRCRCDLWGHQSRRRRNTDLTHERMIAGRFYSHLISPSQKGAGYLRGRLFSCFCQIFFLLFHSLLRSFLLIASLAASLLGFSLQPRLNSSKGPLPETISIVWNENINQVTTDKRMKLLSIHEVKVVKLFHLGFGLNIAVWIQSFQSLPMWAFCLNEPNEPHDSMQSIKELNWIFKRTIKQRGTGEAVKAETWALEMIS